MVEIRDIKINTLERMQIIDITNQVEKYVLETGIRDGIIAITTKHTTTAIRINESEPRLIMDMKKFLRELVPEGKAYLHDDIEKRQGCPIDEPKNAHAHLQSLLMGASEIIPIKDGKLSLGKWQRIFFVELDGPRRREFSITVMAE